MQPKHSLTFPILLLFLFHAGPSLAYVGPGAGLSAIGSVLAFIGVIFLMIAGFFWYPFKRLITRFRKNSAPMEETEELDAK